MRSYVQIAASASDKAPFSNSTDGYAWIDQWCDRCANDTKAPDEGCLILLVGLMGKTPAEWLPDNRMKLGHTYRCTEFRKARPKPAEPAQEIPGQMKLFHEETP